MIDVTITQEQEATNRIVAGAAEEAAAEERGDSTRLVNSRRPQAEAGDVGNARLHHLLMLEARELAERRGLHFGRVAGTFRSQTTGQVVQEDARVARVAYQHVYRGVDGDVLQVVSTDAEIAKYYFDPARKGHDVRPQGPGDYEHVDVIDVSVQDIEIVDGHVRAVSERFGQVWRDRVSERLARSRGRTQLDVAFELLDPQQSELIVRSDAGRVLVVDGAAGTGKTLVALHRVTMLPGFHQPGFRGLYLVPTETLRAFIAPALPVHRMGSERMEATTPGKLLREVLRGVDGWKESQIRFTEDDPWWAAAARQDPDGVMDAVQRTILEMEANATSYARTVIKMALAGLEVLSPDRAEAVRKLHVDVEVPGRSAVGHVIDVFAFAERGEGLAVDLPGRAQAQAVLRALQEVFRETSVAGFLSEEVVQGVLARFDLDIVAARAQGQIRYKREHGQPDTGSFTQADLWLLVWIAAQQGLGAAMGDLRVVIVDEAQALHPLAFRALRRLMPEAKFVLAGDLRQATHPVDRLRSWDEAFAMLGLYGAVVHLHTAYRSAPEVYAFTSGVAHDLPGADPEDRYSAFDSRRGVVRRITVGGGDEQAQRIAEIVGECRRDGLGNVGVIVPARQVPSKTVVGLSGVLGEDVRVLDGTVPYLGGVAVATLPAVAGIEFDAVVLADMDEGAYPNDEDGLRAVYAGSSRARERVYLLEMAETPAEDLLTLAEDRLRREYDEAIARVGREAGAKARELRAELARLEDGAAEALRKHPGDLAFAERQARRLANQRRLLEQQIEDCDACARDPEQYRERFAKAAESGYDPHGAMERMMQGRGVSSGDDVSGEAGGPVAHLWVDEMAVARLRMEREIRREQDRLELYEQRRRQGAPILDRLEMPD